MKVKIQLHGIFRIDRFKVKSLEYPTGSTVLNIVEELKIPRNLLGIVMINGVHADVENILHDGDSIMLLPLLGGG